jgi:peptidoglycan/LPS O-acetylase OafA/YrhL
MPRARRSRPGQAASPRLESLTGLRFVAALAVFTRHANPHGFLVHLTAQGASGVSFFFVLSGFVLAWNHRQGDQRRAFYHRRFARVYPAYAFVLVTSAAVHLLHHSVFNAGGLVAALLLVQSWIPLSDYYYAINGVSWSLACEAFFYALFPALVERLVRLTPPRRRQLLIALCLFVVLLPAAVHTNQVNDGTGVWLIYIFPATRLAEFVIGMLVALAVRDGQRPPIPFAWSAIVAAVAYVVAGFVPVYLMWAAVTIVPFVLLIWATAVHDLDGRPSFLSRSVSVRLGTWSYAFYLVHTLILSQVNSRGGQPYAVRILVALAASVVVAAAIHRHVERPLERRLRSGRDGLPGADRSRPAVRRRRVGLAPLGQPEGDQGHEQDHDLHPLPHDRPEVPEGQREEHRGGGRGQHQDQPPATEHASCGAGTPPEAGQQTPPDGHVGERRQLA